MDVGSMFYNKPQNVDAGTGAMPQATPKLLLENQSRVLQNEFGQREQQLMQQRKSGIVDDAGYMKELQKLQQDFDNQYFSIQNKMQQIEQLNAMSDAGLMQPGQSNEAAWRSILPKDTEQAMFPKAASERAPLSPNQLEKATERAIKYAAAAEAPRRYSKFNIGGYVGDMLRGREVPQGNLLSKYDAWRTEVGYSARTPAQRAQLDQAWDQHMNAKDNYEWDPDSKEVRARRAKGRLGSALGSRLTGTLTNEGDVVTPLQQQIRNELQKKQNTGQPKQLIQLDKVTARQILQEAGGDKNKARKLAKEQGYKF